MPTVTSENSLQFKLNELAKQGIIKPVKLSEAQSKEPKINNLKAEVDKGISEHMALSPPARVANTKRAMNVVADYIGRDKKGFALPLLTQNGKMVKAQTGTDESEPVTLPDGRGVQTLGLTLSPAYEEGNFTTCPNAKACKSTCNGKTSGGYFRFGGGADLDKIVGPRMVQLQKTQAFLRNPADFAIRLSDEITAAKMIAGQYGDHLAVRLNEYSDIHPKVWESVIKAHPDVTFYDYTKNNVDPLAPNHHLTYSSTGISTNEVHNPHQNWKLMRKRLDKGDNVAMSFSHKEQLPLEVHDEETGKRYKVIDGDTHDFRPLDQQPEGYDGVIIGLRNKAQNTSQENATEKSGGFLVPYDPQIMKAKGKIIRDEMGKPIVQNRIVKIPPQGKSAKNVDNNGEVLA